MNEEKYGIQLEAITSAFKNKMQDLSSFIRKFGKEAEEETTISPVFQADKVGSYQRQIEYLESQMDALKDTFKAIKAGTITGDITKVRAEYEILNNKLGQLIEKQNEYNEDLEEMGDDGEKSTSMLSSLFDKSIGKIKRFTYYLLGARSVFSLFMKYQSIYYQYNEQMQYQSELSQNAIALSLAPAFEFLGNVVAYASIGIAKFIELLTGVNILSKVTTKGIRDYNKSLKETQTLLSGVDEITNLTLPSGTGLASQYAALDEFQKKVAEVTEWFDKQKWLKDIATWIKDGFGYIVDNWDKLKYLFLGLGVAGIVFDLGFKVNGLMTALGTASSVGGITAGTGLAGFSSLIAYLATLGGISIGIAVIVSDAVKLAEMKADYERILEIRKELDDQRETIFDKDVELINEQLEKIKETEKGSEEWHKIMGNIDSLMQSLTSAIALGGEHYEDYIPIVQEIGNKIEEITGKDYTAEITLSMDTGRANEQAKGFFGTIKAAIKGVFHSFEPLYTTTGYIGFGIKNSLIKMGLYEKGLDYVPYDEYPALLHKGEAVVPAEYNPTIHSAGNEYTNSLLETMIIKLDDIASRPNVFEIDGHEFANATYPLYRNEENRQNYNAKVSVK